MEEMSEKGYKIIQDNLGEYNILRKDNTLVCSEIQDKAKAELIVDELNEVYSYYQELKTEHDRLHKVHGLLHDEHLDLEIERDKFKRENLELKEENKSWLKTASRMDTIHHEDREYCERIHRENEKLKQENQQYKSLLRDMGLLMSGEDVMAIRNNFADKIIKPIFAESGFDVDVDTSNGFAISLKEEKE